MNRAPQPSGTARPRSEFLIGFGIPHAAPLNAGVRHTGRSHYRLSMKEHADKLGPAQIHLAGLQIWVHSRQFPEANDYWDGNWINVTVHCGAKGADVWTSGAIIHLPEIRDWADACERLYKTLSGDAKLACMEPELSIEMKMREHGHMAMEVSITPDHLTQGQTFQFEIDQSYLKEMLKGCRQVLAAYRYEMGRDETYYQRVSNKPMQRSARRKFLIVP